MAKVKRSSKVAGPQTFPPHWPAWRKIKCPLCGAEPGAPCIDLTAALSQKTTTKDGARIKTRPALTNPHQQRVDAAAKAKAGAP